MSRASHHKYRPYTPVELPDRTWPSRRIAQAPTWCSVNLRDGNQALVEPMGYERKLEMFRLLVKLGFREIEVGFPAASETEFDFVRRLIVEGHIPDGVTIQVLTQARDPLIQRTFEAIAGARRVIVHLYNSTSELQRRVVFELPREGIIDIAVRGVRLIRELSRTVSETEIVLEYSPESFTGTELDFAKDVCESVLREWGASPERKVILNLPATVEVSTPNVYADQIEWMGRHVAPRDAYVLSVHPHNDRGTAVAAAELAVMAGAERVEGTLFGNGERTGNVDVVNLALNLLTQGVDPGLEIDDIDAIAAIAKRCTQLPIHPRHPYAGELVFTAFSGSHQDAIKKGFAARRRASNQHWEIPYLPIDPGDLGRSYEAIVRINSQSGKGGVSYVLEEHYGFRLPRRVAIELSQRIQAVAESTGLELTPERIWEEFDAEYLARDTPLRLGDHQVEVGSSGSGQHRVRGFVHSMGQRVVLDGVGNGPIAAFVAGLNEALGAEAHVGDYSEHALSRGEDSEAVAYVEMRQGSRSAFGVGRAESIVTASFKAVISAMNRLAAMDAASPSSGAIAAGFRQAG